MSTNRRVLDQQVLSLLAQMDVEHPLSERTIQEYEDAFSLQGDDVASAEPDFLGDVSVHEQMPPLAALDEQQATATDASLQELLDLLDAANPVVSPLQPQPRTTPCDMEGGVVTDELAAQQQEDVQATEENFSTKQTVLDHSFAQRLAPLLIETLEFPLPEAMESPVSAVPAQVFDDALSIEQPASADAALPVAEKRKLVQPLPKHEQMKAAQTEQKRRALALRPYRKSWIVFYVLLILLIVFVVTFYYLSQENGANRALESTPLPKTATLNFSVSDELSHQLTLCSGRAVVVF